MTILGMTLTPGGVSELQAMLRGFTGTTGLTGLTGGTRISATAATALGGSRAVILDATGAAAYADCMTATHLGRVVGITNGAFVAGATATVIKSEVLVDATWAWTPNAAIYLGAAGVLTQTVTPGGFQQVLGIAIDAISIFVSLREPVRII